MGYRVKPVLIVVLAALAAAVLISSGLVAYKLKTGSFFGGRRDDDRSLLGAEEYPEDEAILKRDGPEWERHLRLNPDVYPLAYRLHLHPDFEGGTFTGFVSVHLNVSRAVDHVRLHVKFLNVSSTQLSRHGGSGMDLPLQRAFEYEPNEYWVVEPTESLPAGEYNLTLRFSGSLTKGIVGFYRSQYLDTTLNSTKYVVSSKFQPTYARRAFPCFDEPSFKSTYKVSLVKPSELTALSNMPVESEEVNQNLTTVHFQNSVPMVTYLVAFAIGDFAYKENVTKSGVPVRVYATTANAEFAQYAASITPTIVDYFEHYFDTKYPLPKLDIIGVPDFIAGATEHWGLISFREVNLLYNPEKGSPGTKQRVAAVVAHELAHMWFGNLVTLKWWNDLWLNEGFASYIEYAGMNAVHPDWEMESQFVSLDLAPVLQLDGQLSSHPIVQQVSNPNQINEIFDTIAYQKGSSIIRMLKHFMGPTNFQQGLIKFLKKFAFKNAVTQDLWDALQSEAPPGVNVSFVMDTWTRQMGYPVVSITTDDNGVTSVAQERFFSAPDKRGTVQPSPFGFQWEVPMLVSTSEGPASTQLVWLPHGTKSMKLDVSSAASWVKVNTGQLGYFRSKYEAKALKEISPDFQAKFSPEERCGLLDDVFSLAYANYTTYKDAFEFGLTLKQESHAVPWRCADNHLKRLLNLLNYASPETYGFYRKYLEEISQGIYKRLEWTDSESDPHLERILKPRIFSLACDQGTDSCRRKAQDLFGQWLEKNVTVPTSLRGVVYKWGIWQGDDQAWDQVWNRYLTESDPSEKITLLQALSYSQEPWVISRLLEYAKYETLIRRQDYFLMCRYIGAHPVGNAVLWTYYRNQIDALIQRFGLHDRYFGRMIADITAYFTTETQLESIQQLFQAYPDAGAGLRARKSALENVQNNILWTKRSLNSINDWLKPRYG